MALQTDGACELTGRIEIGSMGKQILCRTGGQWGGHYEVLSLLIEKGADHERSTKDKLYPIHLAAFYGHLKVVQILTTLKTRYFEPVLRSPLHLAAQGGHKDVVGFLIESEPLL